MATYPDGGGWPPRSPAAVNGWLAAVEWIEKGASDREVAAGLG
jgi:hypothetical protein